MEARAIKSSRLATALCAVMFCGTPGYAALVMWTLDNVRFDQGGAGTGWFKYDASNSTLLDWNIQTEGEAILCEARRPQLVTTA
jgi:hypothetical protein